MMLGQKQYAILNDVGLCLAKVNHERRNLFSSESSQNSILIFLDVNLKTLNKDTFFSPRVKKSDTAFNDQRLNRDGDSDGKPNPFLSPS